MTIAALLAHAINFHVEEGDALSVLRTLPDACVQTVCTSPPYWGLRDYGTAAWEGGETECDHLMREGVRQDGGRQQVDGFHGSTKSNLADKPYRDVCGKCGARRIDQQLGLEQTPDEYVARMVEVFREVRRVLRDDGTLWLVIGSSFINARIESDEYVLREDLTPDQRAWVYAELAKHFAAESATMSAMRQTPPSTEPEMSSLPPERDCETSELPETGV